MGVEPVSEHFGDKGKHCLYTVGPDSEFMIPGDGRMVLMSRLFSGQSGPAGSRGSGWLTWHVSEARASPSTKIQEHSHRSLGQASQT